MFDLKKVMAFIPARGGSKGIKNKNIIDFEGKSLISYTIESALESRYIDKVFVSTDSEHIAKIAMDCGAEVPFIRPKRLASDTARTIDAVCHFVNEIKNKGEYFDIFVLLQPTSPLRTTKEIDQAIELFGCSAGESVVSVSEVRENPLLMRKIGCDGKMTKVLNLNSTVRRQDMEKVFRINGSIYVNSFWDLSPETSFNDNSIPFIMPLEHSVDIDDYVDLEVAKYYLKERKG